MAETVFTPAQWEAARMLVARLHCEATEEDFDYSSVGMQWLSVDDSVCARTEKGVEIRLNDIMFAAMVMLWSVLVEQSTVLEEDSPLDAVARLGMGLAVVEPDP